MNTKFRSIASDEREDIRVELLTLNEQIDRLLINLIYRSQEEYNGKTCLIGTRLELYEMLGFTNDSYNQTYFRSNKVEYVIYQTLSYRFNACLKRLKGSRKIEQLFVQNNYVISLTANGEDEIEPNMNIEEFRKIVNEMIIDNVKTKALRVSIEEHAEIIEKIESMLRI